MKKLLILGIIGILTISILGCNTNYSADNVKSNDESINVSTDISNNSNSDKSNDENGDGDINISSNETIDKKIPLGDATNIDVEIGAAVVSVKGYDGDEVKISGKLSEKSKGMNINKNENKIHIVEKGYEISKSFKNTEDDTSKIDILVPMKFKENFRYKQGVGKSYIEGIKVKNINITGGTGELKCEDIKFDKLDLDSGVGKVDLDLKEKCGDIDIKGDVGETNVKMAEVGGDLKYQGGVGSSNITIPKDSPVKFVTEKGVGSCKVNAKTSGEGTYTFDLKVGVGSINVRN